MYVKASLLPSMGEVMMEEPRILKVTMVGARDLRNCDAAAKGQGCSSEGEAKQGVSKHGNPTYIYI